jgi:hypothetical protein
LTDGKQQPRILLGVPEALLCPVPEACPQGRTTLWSKRMQATYSRSLNQGSPFVPQRWFNCQRFCVRTLTHLPQAALYSESKIWLRDLFPWGPTCIHRNSFAIYTREHKPVQFLHSVGDEFLRIACVFRMLIVFMWHDAIKPCKVLWTESVPIQRTVSSGIIFSMQFVIATF